ncbi:MAG: hypothetical protein HYX33_04375 [Actinobacteria bacterium]|nr:hypothetical protein [Actinomycetota bacterium]
MCSDQTLLGFFVRRTGDPHTARDLWAEIWARAFAARRRFRGSTPREAESWLDGSAYRQLAQYHRRGAIDQCALRRAATEAPALSYSYVGRPSDLADVSRGRATTSTRRWVG